MEGLHLKLVSANDPDVFQDRINRLIQGLPKDALIVDIKFSTAPSGSQMQYSALVQYKAIEEWTD
jgi:hypothetical protein